MRPVLTWLDDQRAEFDGVKFLAATSSASPDEFLIIKPPDLVRRYVSLIEKEQPRSIVELGVKEGGSAALMMLVADPDVLVAVDLATEVPPLLSQLVVGRDLTGRLIPRFGIDQSDRAALTAALNEAVGDRLLDLVVDDASHVLSPTRASFEVLFPRLRPGGLFVIEDWSSEMLVAVRVAKSVSPTDPTFRDRLVAVRSLIHSLNAPGFHLPTDVLDAIAAAGSAHLASQGDSDQQQDGSLKLLGYIVDAAATVDLELLRSATSAAPRPLVDMAVELMMMSATTDLIEDVSIDGEWIAVRRGPGEIDPDGLRLDDLSPDYFGYLD